jgi:hypothetical protein
MREREREKEKQSGRGEFKSAYSIAGRGERHRDEDGQHGQENESTHDYNNSFLVCVGWVCVGVTETTGLTAIESWKIWLNILNSSLGGDELIDAADIVRLANVRIDDDVASVVSESESENVCGIEVNTFGFAEENENRYVNGIGELVFALGNENESESGIVVDAFALESESESGIVVDAFALESEIESEKKSEIENEKKSEIENEKKSESENLNGSVSGSA